MYNLWIMNWQIQCCRLLSWKTEKEIQPTHRIHFLRTAWFRYAAAITIMIGIGAYLWSIKEKNSGTAQNNSIIKDNDVAPPTLNRATITLANGQQIEIDSTTTGTLASQGNVDIQKMNDGRIMYKGISNKTEVQYNTLTVPRGSNIATIVLSDGSKVFLNSASYLRYPVSFIGDERKVEIEGEAYFEIAKDPKKKFIVVSRGVETEVLGTHFNVNAYPDEQTLAITLVEGKVKVKKGNNSLTIIPGEQVTSSKGILTKNADVNLEQVIAWKNGRFLFGGGQDIAAVLRQVSRWYDVDIQYQGEIKGTIGGSLSRQVNVSKVLELLQSTGSINYKIVNKTVIISPFKEKMIVC